MSDPRAPTHATLGSPPKTHTVDPDATVRWGCSMKGWNCCVDKGITVRPYDMLRLRHAIGLPSRQLIEDGTVTLAWDPADGSLTGSLTQRSYRASQVACVFLDVVTNVSAREMRAADPDRFASMPEIVQRAADLMRGEWDVAGLCMIHSGRPEACRGFPYQRRSALNADGSASATEVHQVTRCGSCALSTPTTPREVLEGEQIADYWQAADAFRRVERYLHSLGIANVEHQDFRAHSLHSVGEIWAQLYLPDEDTDVAEEFPDQWRESIDVEGDLLIYRRVLDRAMDRAEQLIAKQAGDHRIVVDSENSHRRSLPVRPLGRAPRRTAGARRRASAPRVAPASRSTRLCLLPRIGHASRP